ncbi:MAG TPA: DUF6624 domain-containing protein [Thermodesulfobacteriota bacterium]|nr:DUF6624 domain-containing protein [Thermodesulfobacteriota bacterium]
MDQGLLEIAALQKQELEPDFNRERAERLIDLYLNEWGWPAQHNDKDALERFWLLIQHADTNVPLQSRALRLLETAVSNGYPYKHQLAYLTDRVLVNTSQRQKFATQVRVVNGRLEPHPYEKTADIDLLRERYNLPPLEAYMTKLSEINHLPH